MKPLQLRKTSPKTQREEKAAPLERFLPWGRRVAAASAGLGLAVR